MEDAAHQMSQSSGYRITWWRSGVFPVLLLFACLLASLYLLSNATEDSTTIGPYYGWLLLGNALGLTTLTGILGYQLYRLVVEYRQKRAGIRLTLRMILVFVLLAVVPVSLVYLLSVQFLVRGIDSWFDVRIETALNDSLDLSRYALSERIREKARETLKMAESLADKPTSVATLDIFNIRLSSSAEEIALLDTSGRVYAYSSDDPEVLLPNTPSELVYSQLRQGYPYLDMELIKDQGFFIRVVMAIPDTINMGSGEKRLLQALYPVSERLNTLAQSVQSAFAAYKELSYIRGDLKKSFILTLSLALALNILVAVIVAVMSARYLVAPIRILIDGTKAVATGDYGKRLPVTSSDELGLLLGSFNEMTQRIAETSRQVKASREIAEEERAYVQAVLSRLSSGVLTLDPDRRIVTMNIAARKILGVDKDDTPCQSLYELAERHPYLSGFCDCLKRNLGSGKPQWQEQLTQMNRQGRQVLMVSGTLLSPEQGHEGEHVIMLDDVTEFVQAQRNAAWGEMARRLAHEIKNPLTPIQLSAERIRHKCLKEVDGKSAQMLDSATSIIIDQVEAMQEMVNAFTQYARSPELDLQPLSLNDLVREILEMYQGLPDEPTVELVFDEADPLILADAGRIRQLLHNLVRNAFDAIQGQASGRLKIETLSDDARQGGALRLVFEDNGPGFDPAILNDVFEPYVTTKDRGTGLGLAIVKKIVEEHNGIISVHNLDSGGAQVVVILPGVSAEQAQHADGVKHA